MVVKSRWLRGAILAVALASSIALIAVAARKLQRIYPGAARYPVSGIDVSHHQREIEWEKVAASGVAFAYMKASEGADWRDRSFAANWSGAERAGIARGAYHFFTFCTPGAAQAANFLAAAPPQTGALPPAADVEFVGNCESWKSLDDVRRELGVFLADVEKAWGVRPVLYLTNDALNRIARGHFDDHPLWIRSVFFGDPEDRWVFWQHSEKGNVPGVRGRVDLDVFAGSADDLRMRLRR